MELLKFELYKIFKQKMVYVTFILLIVFSTGFTFYNETETTRDIYREWEGTITEEKVHQAEVGNAELMKKLDEMGEGYIFSESELAQGGVYETIAYGKQIEVNAQEKVKELEKETNYNTELEKAMLKEIDSSYFAYNRAPMQIIDYASIFSILLTGAMLLIGLSTMYTQEYSSGVDNYVFSSKKGRRSLMWSKIAASIIYTFVVVIAWEIFNIFWNLIQYGNGGWETSLQYYFKYYFSPYSFTMLEFHLIQIGIHILAACSFAIMVVLISSLCKNALVSLIINGAIFATPYLIAETLQLPNWIEDIFLFSFLYIMNVEPFFDQFKTVNLFGYPVLYPIIAVLFMIVLAAVVVSITSMVVKNREVTT